MPTTRVAQALIMAGPSGAGKTALLRSLSEGRLPAELMAELPPGAERWPVVCAGHPDQWSIFDRGDADDDALEGIVVHYDVTTAWHWHKRDFRLDPFWRLLRDCPTLTWVEIRPPRHRLIAQWCNVQIGMPSVFLIRLWNLYAAAVKALLAGLRRLRRQRGTAENPHWRYPRPLRFLKRIDLRLRSIAPIRTTTLEFYQEPGNVERMLDRWDEAADEIFGARLVKRIALVPDRHSPVGRRMSWRTTAVAAFAARARIVAFKET